MRGVEMKAKIGGDQIPTESCSFRIIAGPRVAEETVICIRDLDIHARFPGALAFVHDSARLFNADMFIKPAPEKQNWRMQISDSRQERRRDVSSVERN